jgi:hypothetical protein
LRWQTKSNLHDQELFIEDILIAKGSNKPGVHKFGLMVENMKGNGKTARLVAKVDFGMLTAIPMKASGCKIKQTDMDFIYIQTELNTWVIGKTMFNMVGARKHGQMVQGSKAITRRERNTVMALTIGQMDPHLLEAGLTTKLMGMEYTRGQMGASLKGTGKTTTCMVKESTLGPMAVATKGIMKMIKSMVMAFTLGATAGNITDNG